MSSEKLILGSRRNADSVELIELLVSSFDFLFNLDQVAEHFPRLFCLKIDHILTYGTDHSI